ncbi:MAG: RlmE family RNA methyltransferase [Alphaproteobacteria bacterium]|nr:RlmE family RNA methyltransferase [Alphaproteobacteria bacterium]MCL2758346.1 RlmE family RNA methyltransferase [Alphaproteobacteria bacterium]
MRILNKKIAKSKSSTAWIQRQAADPYVARAQKDGYRARAAYKIIEINDKYKFLKNGQAVVDLGAAPGSWSQYIAKEFPKSRVVAMDLLPIKPIDGVEFYEGDFTTDEALDWLRKKSLGFRVESLDSNESQLSTLNSKLCTTSATNSVDVVLSDMAPNTCGHQKTDHLRQMTLLEYAWDFAKTALKPGGAFVAKSFTGGTTTEILLDIKKHFEKVHHIKPESSRKDSVEMFIVALGFKGA